MIFTLARSDHSCHEVHVGCVVVLVGKCDVHSRGRDEALERKIVPREKFHDAMCTHTANTCALSASSSSLSRL